MVLSEDQPYDFKNYQESLEHHGIKGQKHGVRRGPPYPLKDGAKNVGSTKVKKKVPSNSDRATRGARAAKKIAKAEKKAKEAKERAEKKAVRDKKIEELRKVRQEQKRRDILNSPSKLYKHRKEFSKEEIDEALKRFEWEKKLRNYSQDKLENGSNYIKSIFNITTNAVNLYNRAASIINSIDSDSHLPTIRPASDFYKKLEDDKTDKKGKTGKTDKK